MKAKVFNVTIAEVVGLDTSLESVLEERLNAWLKDAGNVTIVTQEQSYTYTWELPELERVSYLQEHGFTACAKVSYAVLLTIFYKEAKPKKE
ncbi:MAG: hypothetical protein KBD29_03830 [Candidatus Magasanikbacteria bacterium]|nr:hypothetical protein [Candidatus Magasanikbacteria bacterium]